MILPGHTRLRDHLPGVIAKLYAIEPASVPALALDYPPNRDLGDLGTPAALELARPLRKAPAALARLGLPPRPGPGRPRHTRCVRARPPASEGAARDRSGGRGRVRDT